MTREARILIIEDDDVTAECLSDLLASEGYTAEVLPAPRTVEAIRQAQPDLVLLDLILPDTGGEDLLRGLRAASDLANLPVVVLSAVPRLAERAASLPVQGCVAKPFELDVLLHTVREALGQAELRAPSPNLEWARAQTL